MNVGFIGLGTMGAAMAANVLKAGHQVCVWNRSAQPVAELVAAGAQAASSPAEAATGVAVVISMLSDDQATHDVMITQRALAGLQPGTVYVNMATVSLECTRELARYCAELGVEYLAAPVLGRVNVAQAGQLHILAGGKPAALASVQPLLDAMGQKTWFMGEQPEQANVVKLAVNFMLASAIETTSEAVALTKAYGIEAASFIDLITSTLFAVPAYKGYGQSMVSQTFEPAGFKLSLGWKDVRLTLKAAEDKNVALPFGSVLKDSHLESLAHGEGHLDWAALSRVMARRCGQLK